MGNGVKTDCCNSGVVGSRLPREVEFVDYFSKTPDGIIPEYLVLPYRVWMASLLEGFYEGR